MEMKNVVLGLVMRPDGRILLIMRVDSLTNQKLWALPGGRKEKQKDGQSADTFRREMGEELNLEKDSEFSLGTHDIGERHYEIFFAEIDEDQAEGIRYYENGQDRHIWVRPDQINKLEFPVTELVEVAIARVKKIEDSLCGKRILLRKGALVDARGSWGAIFKRFALKAPKRASTGYIA